MQYDYTIQELSKSKAKLIKGYEYVANSPLAGVEEVEACEKIKVRIKELENAIQALQFFTKFL